MSHLFKIPRILSRRDLAALHRDFGEAKTVNELKTWLSRRGYKVSRNAVWGYRRSFAATWQLRTRLEIVSDGDARRRIRDVSKGLRGQQLAMLATFASFLAAGSNAGAIRKKKRAKVHRKIKTPQRALAARQPQM